MGTSLENKVAVIYGAGGAIGSTVAREFARQGARVFLGGRTLAKIESLAKEITAAGGKVEAARVDATDEASVEQFVSSVVTKTGKLDISFNAISVSQKGIQGTPFLDLPLESYERPFSVYTRSAFLTARAAGRKMVERGSGTILSMTATPARLAVSGCGGMPGAWAAIENFSRCLAHEVGPKGVRVACIRAEAFPETPQIHEVFAIHAEANGIPYERFEEARRVRTFTNRLPKLVDVASAATFVASNEGLTATVINLSSGGITD